MQTLTPRNIYGNEQRHHIDMYEKIKNQIVTPLKLTATGRYKTEAECKKETAKLTKKYQKYQKYQKIYDGLGFGHLYVTGDTTSTVAPEYQIPYPPIDGSTKAPPATDKWENHPITQ